MQETLLRIWITSTRFLAAVTAILGTALATAFVPWKPLLARDDGSSVYILSLAYAFTTLLLLDCWAVVSHRRGSLAFLVRTAAAYLITSFAMSFVPYPDLLTGVPMWMLVYWVVASSAIKSGVPKAYIPEIEVLRGVRERPGPSIMERAKRLAQPKPSGYDLDLDGSSEYERLRRAAKKNIPRV